MYEIEYLDILCEGSSPYMYNMYITEISKLTVLNLTKLGLCKAGHVVKNLRNSFFFRNARQLLWLLVGT